MARNAYCHRVTVKVGTHALRSIFVTKATHAQLAARQLPVGSKFKFRYENSPWVALKRGQVADETNYAAGRIFVTEI